jgi:hypothetical protein
MNKRSACRRGRYLQETNIHAHSWIGTRDLSNLAAADLRLRRHGQQDLQITMLACLCF